MQALRMYIHMYVCGVALAQWGFQGSAFSQGPTVRLHQHVGLQCCKKMVQYGFVLLLCFVRM